MMGRYFFNIPLLLLIVLSFCLGSFLALTYFKGERSVDFSIFKTNRLGSVSSQILSKVVQNNPKPVDYFCSNKTSFFSSLDEKYCFNSPKENTLRLFEINLSDNRIVFYQNGIISKTLPIAYQSPYGKWYQTPTGYFDLGVKRDLLKSSIIDVFMEDAVQFYEDFFIHAIPYWFNGDKVTSQFSGGCIRLEDNFAKEFYNLAQSGDEVVSYVTLDNLKPKAGFSSPVDQLNYWVRQRFNSPLKNNWKYSEDKKDNYIQHAGLDLSPLSPKVDQSVFSIYDGEVVSVVKNGESDLGLGNVVILKHQMDDKIFYSLYGHLSHIESSLSIGSQVFSGSKIGQVGNTGYGCNFWKIGDDSCQESNLGEDDIHLHIEIKTKPILGSPEKDNCSIKNSRVGAGCIGYTSDNPNVFGFDDPLAFIFEEI